MIYDLLAILSFFNSQNPYLYVAVVGLSIPFTDHFSYEFTLVVYVCWKSRGSPAARGRISIELSMDDLPIEFPADPVDNSQTAGRGWWDYVPNNQEATDTSGAKLNAKVQNQKNYTSTVKGFFQKIKNPSSSAAGQDKINTQARPNSLAPSSTSKFSRLVPRMELFRQVMKDEVSDTAI